MQSPDLFPTMLSWSGKAFGRSFWWESLQHHTCYSVLTLIWHWYCMTLQSKQTGIMGVFGDLGGGLKFLVVCIILLPIPLNMSYWEKQKPWLVEADEVYFGEQPYSCIVECFEMHQEWNFLTNLVCKWGRYSDCYVTSPADNLSFSDAHFELWKASFAARQKRQHRLTTRTVVHLETFLWDVGIVRSSKGIAGW